MPGRILIISTNRELAPQPTVPIGAAWVAEALHLAGLQVRLLDLCFQRDPLQAVEDALRSFKPDGIGVSVRNLDNCDFLSPASFLPEVKEITDLIKSLTGARILLGGAGVSIMPMQVLEYLGLDYAVVGEGERAAVEFFSDERGQVHAIPGLVARVGREPEPSRPPMTTPAVMPRSHNWVDASCYLKLEPVLPVQGKRGCANRCLYCTYGMIEGTSWRLREPGSVVEEICSALRHTGAREFEFVDSIFNEPEGYLEALLEEILRRQVKVKLRASSLSPRGLTRGQLELMERAGFTSFVLTPESASDVTLAALRKDFGEDDVNRAADLCAGSSIRALWCFMVGAPMEDERSLRKTADFIDRHVGGKDAAFITTGIRVYPGTGLHDVAVREGVIDPSDDLLLPKFYFSPKLGLQKAMDVLRTGITDTSRCIFVSDTCSSSLNTLRRIGTMLNLPGPFWRYARFTNKIAGTKRMICRNWSSVPAARK